MAVARHRATCSFVPEHLQPGCSSQQALVAIGAPAPGRTFKCCSCLLQGAKDTDRLLTLVVGNQTFLSDPTAADRRPVELLVAQVRAELLSGQHKVRKALAASFLIPSCIT